MLKNVLAVISGIVVSVFVVIGMDMLSHSFYGHADPEIINTPQKFAEYVQTLPIGAFIILILGHFLAALFGSIITLVLSSKNRLLIWFPVGILLLSVILNLALIPHPLWFMIADVIAPILGGIICLRLVKR